MESAGYGYLLPSGPLLAGGHHYGLALIHG
jgi:hypothetical protein